MEVCVFLGAVAVVAASNSNSYASLDRSRDLDVYNEINCKMMKMADGEGEGDVQ